MHTAPGGQNGGWHCDSGIHIANFWIHKDFQDRLVWLWTEIAKRYANNPWIAGYNLLNEPADPEHSGLVAIYDRLIHSIHEVDPKHVIFLDGNTFATDFSQFPDNVATRWENCAFAIHDYSVFGFPSTPEPYTRAPEQRTRMQKSYSKKREWLDQKGLCVWNGEFGPVYARPEYEGDETDRINDERYQVLKDQLDMYQKVFERRHLFPYLMVLLMTLFRIISVGRFGYTRISASKGWYTSLRTHHTGSYSRSSC